MPYCIKCGKDLNDDDNCCANCGGQVLAEPSAREYDEYVYQEKDRERLLLELLSAAEACLPGDDPQPINTIQKISNIKQLPLDIKACALGFIGIALSLEDEYEEIVVILEESLRLGMENGWALSGGVALHANALGDAYFVLIQALLTEKKLVEARQINKKYENLTESYGANENYNTTLHEATCLYNKGCILVKSNFSAEAIPVFEQVVSEKYRDIVEKYDLRYIIGKSYRILALTFHMQGEEKKAIEYMQRSFKYTEDKQDKTDLGLALGKYYPDHVLGYINTLEKDEIETWHLAKAMAYFGKGLPALMTDEPVNISSFTEEDFREKLGLNDIHLDYLEKALRFFRKHLDEHYAGDDFNSSWPIEHYIEDIDNTCRALERCRPSKVLEILGMTKIYYYSLDKVFVNNDIKQQESKFFLDDYNNESGYLSAALYESSEIFNQEGEQNPIACIIKIYSDGMYYFL